MKRVLAVLLPLATTLTVFHVWSWFSAENSDYSAWWIWILMIMAIIFMVYVALFLLTEKIYLFPPTYVIFFNSLVGITILLTFLWGDHLQNTIDWSAVNDTSSKLSAIQKVVTSDFVLLYILGVFLSIHTLCAIYSKKHHKASTHDESQPNDIQTRHSWYLMYGIGGIILLLLLVIFIFAV